MKSNADGHSGYVKMQILTCVHDFNVCVVCSELFHMAFCCSKEIVSPFYVCVLTAILFEHESNDLIIVT